MLNLIAVIVVLGFTMSTNASEYQFIAVDNSVDTKMCLAAVTNNKKALKRLMYKTHFEVPKFNRIHYGVRIVARKLLCNDLIIANFAYKYQAADTLAYLDRYTSRKDKKKRPTVTIRDIAAQGNDKPTVVLIASN